MKNQKLIDLLNDTLQAMRDNMACLDLKCDCEGNDATKDLALRIKNEIKELESNQ